MGHVRVDSYHPTSPIGMLNLSWRSVILPLWILPVTPQPGSPNSTSSSTAKSQSCAYGWRLIRTKGFILPAITSQLLSLQNYLSFLPHGLHDYACCAQQHGVGYTWSSSALVRAERLWQFLTFVKYTPHPSWLQMPWPSHVRTAYATVCSAFFLFTYFLFLLLQMGKRGRNH